MGSAQNIDNLAAILHIHPVQIEKLIASCNAAIDDVEIIDAITASRLQANGEVVTSDPSLNTGVQSETANESIIITSTGNY